MPRAPKPKPRVAPPSYAPTTGQYSRTAVSISRDGRANLIRLAGVKGDLAAQNEMLKAVHTTLVNHYWYVETLDQRPTEQSRLKRVHPTLAALRSAIKGIEELDYWTRNRLSIALDVPMSSLDKLPVLRKLESALAREVLELRTDAKPHRRRRHALRVTVSSLAMIFNCYRAARSASWREFAAAALSDAGIAHPDPIDQPGRFDKLVIPVIAERVLTPVP